MFGSMAMHRPVPRLEAEGQGVGRQVGIGGGGREGQFDQLSSTLWSPIGPSTGATLTSLTVIVIVSRVGHERRR